VGQAKDIPFTTVKLTIYTGKKATIFPYQRFYIRCLISFGTLFFSQFLKRANLQHTRKLNQQNG
jgi:hypothetical protein